MNGLIGSVRQRLWKGQERRAFQRFKAGIGADVAIVAGTSLSEPTPGVIEDISGGGIRLRAKVEFAAGTGLRVAFALPNESQHAVASVEVVATEPSGDDFISHCKFVDLRRTTLGWQILNWAMARDGASKSSAGTEQG
jgi:hypothetical protein